MPEVKGGEGGGGAVTAFGLSLAGLSHVLLHGDLGKCLKEGARERRSRMIPLVSNSIFSLILRM